jgi:hypothetical protein
MQTNQGDPANYSPALVHCCSWWTTWKSSLWAPKIWGPGRDVPLAPFHIRPWIATSKKTVHEKQYGSRKYSCCPYRQVIFKIFLWIHNNILPNTKFQNYLSSKRLETRKLSTTKLSTTKLSTTTFILRVCPFEVAYKIWIQIWEIQT